MIGTNSEGSIGVGREVKSVEARRPNRPAATPYLGHRLSLRGHKTVTARKARGERPTPPTECRPPVTHFSTSVMGGLDADDRGNWVAHNSSLPPHPSRLMKTPAAVHPLPPRRICDPSERAMNFGDGPMIKSPDCLTRPSHTPPHRLSAGL